MSFNFVFIFSPYSRIRIILIRRWINDKVKSKGWKLKRWLNIKTNLLIKLIWKFVYVTEIFTLKSGIKSGLKNFTFLHKNYFEFHSNFANPFYGAGKDDFEMS